MRIQEQKTVTEKQETVQPSVAVAVKSPVFHKYSSVISFEGLFEMALEELNEISIIDRPKIEVEYSLPPKLSEEQRRLEIGEPFAKLFACSEVAIASNMRDRVRTLPSDPESSSLALRLSRVACFLRRTNFRKGKLLGEGSYGRVFLTRTETSAKEYALKQVTINIPENVEKKAIDSYMLKQVHALREKDVMLMADHPFICKLKASWVEEEGRQKLSYIFLMEYAPFGSLSQFMKEKFHKTMPWHLHNFDNDVILHQIECHHADPLKLNLPLGLSERKKVIYIYAAEMASALDYLHSIGIVHRDFKPGNVLIGVDYHLRIADFGFVNPQKAYHSFQFHSISSPLATHPALRDDPLTNIDEKELRAGTIAYCYTPEILKNQVTDTNRHFPMDMWSLGVTMFVLYTGVHPFSGIIPQVTNDHRLLVREIFLFRRSRLLTSPLYEAIVDDRSYRDLLSRLICEMGNRLTSSQTLNVLNEIVKELTGLNIEELGRNRLDFLIEVFGPVKKDSSPEFSSEWSAEGGSIHSAEGMPAVMKTFPFLGGSPKIGIHHFVIIHITVKTVVINL